MKVYSPSKETIEKTGHLESLFLPFKSGSSIINAISSIFPPNLSISCAPAHDDPPVAIKSSTKRIFSPGLMSSLWTSTFPVAYSYSYSWLIVYLGNFPGFLIAINPTPNLFARIPPTINPRDSIPAILSIFLSLYLLYKISIALFIP